MAGSCSGGFIADSLLPMEERESGLATHWPIPSIKRLCFFIAAAKLQLPFHSGDLLLCRLNGFFSFGNQTL